MQRLLSNERLCDEQRLWRLQRTRMYPVTIRFRIYRLSIGMLAIFFWLTRTAQAGSSGEGTIVNTAPNDAAVPSCPMGNIGYPILFDGGSPSPHFVMGTTPRTGWAEGNSVTTNFATFEGDNGGAIDYTFVWYKWSLSPQSAPAVPVHCRDDLFTHQVENQGWTLINEGLANRCTTGTCTTGSASSDITSQKPPGNFQQRSKASFITTFFACKNLVCGCGGGSCGQCGCDENFTGIAIYEFCTADATVNGDGSCSAPTNTCQLPGSPSYRALARASRRGEVGPNSSFTSTTGPDDGGGALKWGPAYNAGENDRQRRNGLIPTRQRPRAGYP